MSGESSPRLISFGKRAGHRYLRTGRLVFWVGLRRGRDLLAVWWLDRERRMMASGLVIKPPWCPPLYPEAHGNHRPFVKFFGWRLLPVQRA